MGKSFIIFFAILCLVSAHHDIQDPWRVHFHENGLYRTFFGGFFSTLFLIFGIIVFYHFCIRNGALGKSFPLFPKKPIIPITIPFARAPNFIDVERPETILLTTATSVPSVFYSNKGHSPGHWPDSNPVTVKTAYTGYNAL